MIDKRKRVFALLLGLSLLGLTFEVGRQFERFVYTDICLDMGGGRNPGGFPICVVSSDFDPNLAISRD